MSKVWLIAGAGSGIGAGAAKAALKANDRVSATGRNLDKVRNALRDVASESLAFVRYRLCVRRVQNEDGRRSK
jgi:NAD(P)-dependent dehydrogenase (short-subunit alcohol dehydrogenase family)